MIYDYGIKWDLLITCIKNQIVGNELRITYKKHWMLNWKFTIILMWKRECPLKFKANSKNILI